MKHYSIIKRIFALTLVAALMFAFAGSALAAGYVKATGGRVNVRSGPGTEYSDLYTMVKGEAVEYLGVSARDSKGTAWYKVQYYSYGTGWVCSEYSKLTDDSTSTGATGSSYVQASGGNVNIRNTPSLNGKDLATLNNGAKATFLGQTSTDDRGVVWYKVSYNGVTGWASSRYSKLVGSSSSSSGSVSLPDLGGSGSYVKADDGNCNIRNTPSLDGRDLGTIPQGSTGSYLGSKSTDDRGVVWFKVKYNGVTGWVSSRYSSLVGSASSGSSSSSSSSSPSSGVVKAVGGNCNVRTQPNLNGSSVGVMHEGETGTYLGNKSTDDRGVVWYKVKFEGETGWVSSKYSKVY